MESNEEPQKKVFKARKTMRASDRQQLESVYKVKEELLKTTDIKLLNGKHENGDSDLSSPLISSECTEDKEMNGLEDVCLDSEEGKMDSAEITDAPSPDIRESQANDLTPQLETMSPENVTSEQVQEDASNASAPDLECQEVDSNKDNDVQEEVNIKDVMDHDDICVKEDLGQKATPDQSEDESKVSCNVNDCSADPVETNELSLASDLPLEEEKSAEETVVEDSNAEEAISSSMDTDQNPKEEDVQSADLLETGTQKPVDDEPVENIMGNASTMETDEIIPILEKLAPADDELSCFSRSVLLPLESPNPGSEDKVENSLGSPSKPESSESLPKEAFLVLSDEEELCCDKEAEEAIPNHASPSG